MWKIEAYIRNHKSEMADAEPATGHEQRFLQKLENQQSLNRRRSVHSFVFRVAATLLLVASVVWLTMEPFKSSHASGSSAINTINLPDDLKQTLAYYNQKAIRDVSEIKAPADESTEPAKGQKLAMKQIEKLDAQLLSIEKEYVKNPGNEAVRAALVNTQRKKTEIIDNISTQTDRAAKGFRVGEPLTQF